MSPNRTGFTPLVVTSLVFGGIAIITHITAVAVSRVGRNRCSVASCTPLTNKIAYKGSRFFVGFRSSNRQIEQILSPLSNIHRHRQVTIKSSGFRFQNYFMCPRSRSIKYAALLSIPNATKV